MPVQIHRCWLILLSVVLLTAACQLGVPPHPRSQLTRSTLGMDSTNLPGNGSNNRSAFIVMPIEVPAHPRSDLTLAELNGQQARASGTRAVRVVSAILPPHPRSDLTSAELAADFPVQSGGRATEPESLREDLDQPHAIESSDQKTEPVKFKVVAGESTVSYQVYEQFTYVNQIPQLVTAKTQQVSGELILDLSNPPDVVSGFFDVYLPSFNSRDPRRDLAIRSGWLESDRFPIAHFAVEELRNGPLRWQEDEAVAFQLAGQLTIRNRTNPAVFDVNAKLVDGIVSGSATTMILMTDFGFEPPEVVNLVKALDGVTVIVYLTAMVEQ